MIPPPGTRKENHMYIRHFGIELLAAAALLPLAGACTKVESVQEESLTGLSYNVALEQPRTKAATAYSTSETFKSWAWYLPEGQSWAMNRSDAKAYFEDVTVAFQTDKWKGAGGPYYWPKAGSLSFRSYSPASLPTVSGTSTSGVSVTKDGVSLTGWKLNALTHQDTDFMIADFKSDLAANALTYGYLGVPTLFRHKLAKVTIQASTASAPSATHIVKLYKISLKQVYTKGTYTPASASASTAESWSCSELEEIVIFDNAAGLELNLTAQNVTLDGKSLFVIPQILNADTGRGTGNDVSLYIEYSINGTSATADKKLIDIKSYLWGIGQHTVYNVVIGEENEPIEFDAGVSDWTDGDKNDIIIGAQ